MLIAAIAVVPVADTSCKIPLGNGCTNEVLEPHQTLVPVDPLEIGGVPNYKLLTSFNTGTVC